MLHPLELDRALVAERDAQICEIEVEISTPGGQTTVLKDPISVLDAAEEPVQQRLHSYRYPVLTLPNEIIAHIFLHFLPTYPKPPPCFGELSPTFLTHICHHWRGIALTTPALWRAIDLRGFTGVLPVAGLLASLWLERSGCLPLSIRSTEYTFRVFIRHRARWEQVELDLRDPESLSLLDGPSPLLRTLSVRLRNRLPTPVLIQSLPLLRTVVLQDCGPPSLILPWSQLTSLTLRGIYPAECISILRQAQNLVSCTLGMWAAQLPKGRFVDLTLPRLESLAFEHHCDVWEDFLRLLITPALRSLDILEGFLGSTDPVASLNSFISKSGCTLNELRISKAFFDKAVYRKAFPSIPIITCDLRRF